MPDLGRVIEWIGCNQVETRRMTEQNKINTAVDTEYVFRGLSKERAGIIDIEVDIAPRDPEKPVISKEIATLVLNQARSDAERKLMRQSITRINRRSKKVGEAD